MRRLILIASAGSIALGMVSITALSALADTSAPRQPPAGAPALENTSTYDVEAQAAFISQGSAIGASSAELSAVRTDVAEEERLPDYSQVVDNETGGHFSAPGWNEQTGGADQISHGGSYVRSGSGGRPARFKVGIPTSSDYTVYGWWPALSGGVSEAARFGIDTAVGRRWTTVDQTVDGGMWVKLGTYAMKKGERTIQLSAGDSVADAVAVVRGDVTMPPEDGESTVATRKAATFSAVSASEPTRRDVVEVARRWMDIPYEWGTCTRSLMSCTCETKKTYRRFGYDLRMGERSQWRYDERGVREVRREYNLRRGDEVFFKEDGSGNGITHVGVYSGNDNLVHASVYYGKVVESEMKWIDGYFGAKRYKLH